MIKPGYLPSTYWPASVLGIAAAAATTFLASKILCDLPLPFTMAHFDQHLFGLAATRLNELNPIFFPEIAAKYRYFLDHLEAGIAPWKVTWRLDFAASIGLVTGALTTWLVGKPVSDTTYITGRRLFEGKAAHKYIKRALKDDLARSGTGIKLHESFSWPISRSLESTHFWVTGAVGSGKTVIIRSMLDEIIARGDKVLIYDNKGDMTASLQDGFAFISPSDARSLAWDIGVDCSNFQDGRELAAYIVPEGTDPIWHQAARMILGAVIEELQCLKPGAWTWKDLHELACSPAEVLHEITKRRAPEAITFIKEESKTTDGIFANLGSSLVDVSMLSKAWGNAPKEKRFSLTQWLLNPNPSHKVVILQGNGRYPEMTLGYIKAAITLLAGRVDSPELPDDSNRRIWFVLDEFSALKKCERVGNIISVGRSKGCCCILGIQNNLQLQALYGESAGKAWPAMVKTQIVGRVSDETADFIARMNVGEATIERTLMHRGELQPAKTERQLVIEPSELTDYLGPTKTGVKALILGFGDAQILEWPFKKYPLLRPSYIAAEWTFSFKPPTATKLSDQTPRETLQVDLSLPAVKAKPKSTWGDRPPASREIFQIAETGSDLAQAADPLSDMTTQPWEGGVK